MCRPLLWRDQLQRQRSLCRWCGQHPLWMLRRMVRRQMPDSGRCYPIVRWIFRAVCCPWFRNGVIDVLTQASTAFWNKPLLLSSIYVHFVWLAIESNAHCNTDDECFVINTILFQSPATWRSNWTLRDSCIICKIKYCHECRIVSL